LAAAAYHDLGIPIDRYNHAEESVKILKKDPFIIGHFTVSEISIISETILRHRSKYHGDRGSVYGQLLADADKEIDPVESVRRLWGYRMNPNNLTVDQSKRYGTMSDVEKIDDMLRFIQHLYASNDQTYEFELNLPIQKELMAEVIRHMLDTRWVLNVLDNIRGI
jgi:hypothetical protein